MRTSPLALALAVSLVATGAAAQEPIDQGLEYRPSLDVPVTLAGFAGAIGPRLLTDPTATWTCRWCDRDEEGRSTLNGLDAAARKSWRWSDQEKADAWSDRTVFLSGAASVTAFVAARGGIGDGFGGEMLIVLEAAVVSSALTQATKYLTRRARPWAAAGEPPPGDHVGSRESVLSFPSGHTSMAFALAVATGSLASLRDDPGQEWVWATGLTFAAATGYLRVAADRHYLLDVLAGAALGTAVGWAIPRLIDRRPDEIDETAAARASALPMPALGILVGGGTGPRPGGVLLSGGMHGGAPFLSASWSF